MGTRVAEAVCRRAAAALARDSLMRDAALALAARMTALIAVAASLGGCEALALTALGVGASAGVTHTANSISHRTFTATTPQVKKASLAALGRMGIKVEGIDRQDDGAELIRARSGERAIEIELEAMGKSTTQMRASAKRKLFFHDAATAREIVEQTQLALENQAEPRSRKSVRASRGRTEAAARPDNLDASPTPVSR